MNSKTAKKAASALEQALALSNGQLPESYPLKGVLADLAPECVIEFRLLIAAAEEKVPQALCKAISRLDLSWAQNRCIRRLMTNRHLTEEAASYAVEVWSKTLGLATTKAASLRANRFWPHGLQFVGKWRVQIASAICFIGFVSWLTATASTPPVVLADRDSAVSRNDTIAVAPAKKNVQPVVWESELHVQTARKKSAEEVAVISAKPANRIMSSTIKKTSSFAPKAGSAPISQGSNSARRRHTKTLTSDTMLPREGKRDPVLKQSLQLNSTDGKKMTSSTAREIPNHFKRASYQPRTAPASGWTAVARKEPAQSMRSLKAMGIRLEASGRVLFPDRKSIYLDRPTGKLRWEQSLRQPQWSITMPNRIGRVINWNQARFLLCWVYSHNQKMVLDVYERKQAGGKVLRETWVKPKSSYGSWRKATPREVQFSEREGRRLSEPFFGYQHFPMYSLLYSYEIPGFAKPF